MRLSNRLKHKYPHIVQHLPRKKWIGNNFDSEFLEERMNGLQSLVNAILTEPDLISSQQIQDFFCLNEPPVCSETNEESRVSSYSSILNDFKHKRKSFCIRVECMYVSTLFFLKLLN